ncbi:MAG: rhodanese family protein [Symbiopectobacterium sp.]|uniref:rhodanese family protein n=1 Tax=Symbiopectobacterium sp. TaxID=2952789 RepID=UPI0039EC46ED
MATLPYLSVLDAWQRQADGALMADIRQADEYQREHIPQSLLYPLAERTAEHKGLMLSENKTIIFYCLSGARCDLYAEQLKALAPPQGAFLLEGGLSAWKKAGFPVKEDRSQPLPVMRQVQIVAGGLTVTSVALGYVLHPAFFGVAGFIGAGLVFAGISGFCGMAKLLMFMRWNKSLRRDG